MKGSEQKSESGREPGSCGGVRAYRSGFRLQHWKSRVQANIPAIPVLRAEGGRIRSSESHWLPNTSLIDETQKWIERLKIVIVMNVR